MNINALFLSFALSILLMSSVVFANQWTNADDNWFAGWTNLFASTATTGGPAIPNELVNFLTYFGVPSDVLVGWGGLVFYIIIPFLTFAIILKAILIDEIIVNTMKLTQLGGRKGWILIVLILGFLFPTGIVGAMAMWLYAVAGIMVVYGFGALLILAVIQRLTYKRTGGGIIALSLGIIIAALAAVFIPQAGVLIAILSTIMAVYGFSRTRNITKFGDLADDKWKDLNYSDTIKRDIEQELKKKGIRGQSRNEFISVAKNIASDLRAGIISISGAKQRVARLKKDIDQSKMD